MDVYEIEKTAKNIMEKRGSHSSQLMIPGPEGMIMFVLIYKDDDEKNLMRDKVRQVVIDSGCDHYFFITEAWMRFVNIQKPDTPFIKPANYKERREALIICEYKKDMTGKQITLPFERQGKKIIWLERSESKANEAPSLWNFFIEEEGVHEGFDKFINEQNKTFLDNLAKEYADKYGPRFDAATNDDERKVVFMEMLTEMRNKKKAIDNLRRG